jgi:hypothetical protein
VVTKVFDRQQREEKMLYKRADCGSSLYVPCPEFVKMVMEFRSAERKKKNFLERLNF